MNKQAISTTLERENILYLDQMAQRLSVPRSEVLDSILREQYKAWLKKEMQEGYASQGPEEKELAEEGMADYLKIIERDEK